jgi:hypothetical protein
VSITFYMDQHVPRTITQGLRARIVDVLTAYEDGASQFPDPALLDRATSLQRVLFTFDDDLLVEAAQRQVANIPFSGVIYAHPLKVSIGRCIDQLETIAKVGDPEDLANQVEFLKA